MTDLGIEAWQIPLLVAAAIVLVEIAVNAVLRRRGNLTVDKRVRTALLALLLALSVVMFVVVLGPSLAESLSSVAAAVAAMAALWLTYRSYQAPREAGRGGTGGSDAPAQPSAAPADADGLRAGSSAHSSVVPPLPSAETKSAVSPGGRVNPESGRTADEPRPTRTEPRRDTAEDGPSRAGEATRPGDPLLTRVPVLRWLHPRGKARRRG
jgi:hypothetical protein